MTWEKKLDTFSQVMEEWLKCQRSWMHLEAFFANKDMQRQLPEELKQFMGVDRYWRKLMKRVEQDRVAMPHVLSGILDPLRQQNATLAIIQKRIEDVLDVKRKAFPRFCFLSNNELIEILSSKTLTAIQPHMIKCFDNVKSLELTNDVPGFTDVLGMVSSEDERVPFFKPMKARGSVEDWMTRMEQSMQATIHKLLEKAILDYEVRKLEDSIPSHLKFKYTPAPPVDHHLSLELSDEEVTGTAICPICPSMADHSQPLPLGEAKVGMGNASLCAAHHHMCRNHVEPSCTRSI